MAVSTSGLQVQAVVSRTQLFIVILSSQRGPLRVHLLPLTVKAKTFATFVSIIITSKPTDQQHLSAVERTQTPYLKTIRFIQILGTRRFQAMQSYFIAVVEKNERETFPLRLQCRRARSDAAVDAQVASQQGSCRLLKCLGFRLAHKPEQFGIGRGGSTCLLVARRGCETPRTRRFGGKIPCRGR